MNYFALSGFLIGCACAAMALWVFRNSTANTANKIWSLFCVSVAIWGFGAMFIGLSKDPDEALLYWRMSYVGVIFIPTLFYHFVVVFLHLKRALALAALYLVSMLFLVLNLTTNMVHVHVTYMFNQIYFSNPPALLWPSFVAYFMFIVLVSHIELWLFMRKSTNGTKTAQVKWFFVATVVGFSGGVTCFLPTFGFELYPYGNLTVPLYPLIMSYAIVKHQLMDIDVVVKRTAVFAGLFAFVYGTFTIITILGQEFFKDTLGWNQWIATIPTVVIITFSLRPLENFLTNATEKYLFQKKYDYKELLKVFTREILTVIDLEKLTKDTVQSLIEIVKLESASLLLHDKEAKVFRMAASSVAKEKEMVLKETDLLPEYLKKIHQPIQKDKSVEKMEGGELKDTFKRLHAQVCMPIDHHDELIGILALGTKKSGEDFTPDDLDVLMTLVRTEAIAIANARLFDELSKTQAEAAQKEKMAVIGTLASGINHEICNPLGIVRGQCEMFLLNMRDGFYGQKSGEEMLKISSDIMHKVIKETDRATQITKKLSSFAKPSKLSDFEEVAINHETDEVIGLLGHDLRLSNIDIQKDFPENFPLILADKKQIEEVLFNIIRNAAQAMDKKAGKIMVTGFQDNGSVVIRIADNGTGIPQEKIEQIFHPFYTTKAPGKGTGLGLFIVKQVVERNMGQISVESQIGVGTTFTLRFNTAVTTITNKVG